MPRCTTLRGQKWGKTNRQQNVKRRCVVAKWVWQDVTMSFCRPIITRSSAKHLDQRRRFTARFVFVRHRGHYWVPARTRNESETDVEGSLEAGGSVSRLPPARVAVIESAAGRRSKQAPRPRRAVCCPLTPRRPPGEPSPPARRSTVTANEAARAAD